MSSSLKQNTSSLQSLLEVVNNLPSHIEVDTTLTKSGMAADAKVVGDKLNDYYLKSEADTLHIEVREYVDTEVAALVNSAPETLDTLGELAAAFEENKNMVTTIDAAITRKQNIPSIVTEATGALALADNTEYYLTNVSTITLSYPSGNFEVFMHMQFSATGTISLTFPTSTSFIGEIPTFNNGTTWEISIKNGVAICWRVK